MIEPIGCFVVEYIKINMLVLKSKHILDPMWITKKDYIDSEYFTYVLKAAEQKYTNELENGNNEYFYEILFHYLNLNNLVLDGNMFNFKMKSSWRNDRIIEISNELSSFYKTDNESGETVKKANEVFRNLCIDYLEKQCEIFNIKNFNIYYVNSEIQFLNEVYVIININETSTYNIWKLKMDKRYTKGYKFFKVETLKVDNIEETPIKDVIEKIDNKELNKLDPDINLLFCICKEKELDLDIVADSIKNTILLNKLMANDNRFDPNLLENALDILIDENILPFKLSEDFL
tara:strand:+ start:29619 stop:30488 length:870 start_codon:yes stop_codon:yes gene_type:complete